MNKIFSTFQKGIKRIRENHQLGYTILVAIVIFFAFLVVIVQFSSIARDAQDRLVNVRVGSIHDVFATFAKGPALRDTEQLTEVIHDISDNNSTIQEFLVVEFTSGEPIVIAARNPEQVGKIDVGFTFLYSLARSNPGQSFTAEDAESNERLFQTVRAIKGDEGEVIGAIRTTQTLSEADRAINDTIARSLIVFGVVVAVVLLLFFRYARILDYAVLYTKLKEVDKLKDDFVAMASHELRTPLTVIKGYMEYILHSQGLTDEEREFARRIDSSAHHLEDLVSDILDVSQIEQGRMRFDYEVFDLTELARDVTKHFSERAHEKGLSLSFEAKLAAKVYADRARMRQVLTNLIGNAIKYTKEGEVTVGVNLKRSLVELRVRDTGIGISAEEQKKLFAKFYRIQTDETKDISGTGLGLWLTKKIITTMGGKVAIESIKDVGTQFIVTFKHSKS